jgi:hypothetical protein
VGVALATRHAVASGALALHAHWATRKSSFFAFPHSGRRPASAASLQELKNKPHDSPSEQINDRASKEMQAKRGEKNGTVGF